MAVNNVSNKFYVTAIADGSAISAALYATDELSQIYNPQSGVCVPDFSSTQPVIYAVIRVNGTQKAINTGSDTWSYNGVNIEFDSDGYSTNFLDGANPLFYKDTYTMPSTSTNVPALKILRNLATFSNVDNDVVAFSATLELGGTAVPFSTTIPIRITEQSSSGFYGYVGGDSFVDSPTPGTAGYTATMNAYLNNGTDAVSSFKTVWSREGVDGTTVVDGWPKTVTTTTGTATTTINASEITDYTVVRVDFYDANDTNNETLLYSAYWGVDDMQDMEEMYIQHGTNNQNNASLRSGESVTFNIWMAKRTDETALMDGDNQYNKYKCKLIDSAGNVITTSLPGGATADASGFFSITVHNVTVKTGLTPASSGQVSISYDFSHENGDTITGVIVAYNEPVEVTP